MTRTPIPPTAVDAAAGSITDHLGGVRVETPAELRTALAEHGLAMAVDDESRAAAGRDWWPVAIGWATRRQVAARPSAVVRPRHADEVAAVLGACLSAGVPVTPSGGRSGVCGGSIPVFGGVALDLTGLDGPATVDESSLVVDVPAGTFGPDLEAQLRAVGPGYTLGHWPQSIDLSTVGGWLACRGAGQYSTRYGKIEDMVIGLEVALADGRLVRTEGQAPRAATGPNLTQLFVGSEGTLGVITSARLRIRPVPAGEERRAYGFDSFVAGLDACRRILRCGATPAVLRLYDQAESGRNFDRGDTCVLIVLDEADPALVAATLGIVDRECTQPSAETSAAEPLDVALVERWMGHRNDVSALAPLWRAGVVVDTVEVAGRWGVLASLADDVTEALTRLPGTVAASVHQSHAYADGACLYFTFAGRRPAEGGGNGGAAAATPDDDGDPAWRDDYYRRAWDTATSVVSAHGAAISHHHGIGLNRSRFMADALGGSLQVLQAIKDALDPTGILNPGKLGLRSPFGVDPWP